MISDFSKYVLNEKAKNFFDDYDSILLLINTIDDVNAIFNYIDIELEGEEDVDNNLDPHFREEVRTHVSRGDHPYIRYNRNRGQFSYGTLEYLHDGDVEGGPSDKGNYFTADDLPKFKQLIKNNGEIKPTPTYQPKKMVYEGKEYFNEYPHIIIAIRSYKEFQVIMERVKKYKEISKGVVGGIEDYVTQGEEIPYLRYEGKHNQFGYGTLSFLEEFAHEFPNEKIFTINNLDEYIKRMTNRDISSMYSPKKFVYESKNYFDDYNSLLMVIKSDEEMEKAAEYINKELSDKLRRIIGPSFISQVSDHFLEGKRPYIRYNKEDNCFKYGTLEYLEGEGSDYEYTTKKYYDIDDLKEIVFIIKNDGKIGPSYKPKKFVYESKEYFEKNSCILIKLRTKEEIEESYDYIEKNINGHYDHEITPSIKEGAIDYLNEGSMPFFMFYKPGQRFMYGTVSHIERNPSELYTYEKFYTVNDLDEIRNLIRNQDKETPITPTYQPKKFVYESKRYFEKYTHIPIIINTPEEADIVCDWVIEKLNGKLNRVVSDTHRGGLKNVLNEGNIANLIYYKGENAFKYGPKDYTDEHPTQFIIEKYYTVNELDAVERLIKNKDTETPTYKPRKMIYENKQYFEEYKYIPIPLNNEEEIKKAFDYIQKNINPLLSRKVEEAVHLEGLIRYFKDNKTPFFLYSKHANSFMYGVGDFEKYKDEYPHERYYTVDELDEVKKLIKNRDKDIPDTPTYKPRKMIYENKQYGNYFDTYDSIPIKLENDNEIEEAYSYIEENLNQFADEYITPTLKRGAYGYLARSETPQFLFYNIEKNFYYGSVSGLDRDRWKYEKFFTVKELPIVKHIIEFGRKPDPIPTYEPKKFVYENNFNLLLEKSSLTALGIPREVMQPIQRDLALSPDAKWEKINHKREVADYLKKGDKNLFIQIAVDTIKVIVSYPTFKGTMYFIDNYVYRDTEWAGEFEKLKRQYDTLTQTLINIDPRTNIYRLDGDFEINKQSRRKMIKKEKTFMDFSDKFKSDFLQRFDKILKRITGTNFKKAKEKVTDKAKKVAMENNLLIRGLDNPLNGPNGLSILDEFLYQFEEEYSKFFEERIDIHELSKYFTYDKVMTMFMYYIYTGKILAN